MTLSEGLPKLTILLKTNIFNNCHSIFCKLIDWLWQTFCTPDSPVNFCCCLNILVKQFGQFSLMAAQCAHRRRINKIKKGKGHRCCLGAEVIQFLDALAILPKTVLKNEFIISAFSFKSSWCNSSSNRPVQNS